MIQKVLLISIILVFPLITLSQTNIWLNQIKKIKPLATTEKKVERIFGKPHKRYADVGEYETVEGLFTVTYSQGKCKSTLEPKYNVQEGVVIQLDFRPRQEIIFSKLRINVSKWEKAETNDISPATISYSNSKKGFTYDVHNKFLNYVSVFPSDKQDYLQCPK